MANVILFSCGLITQLLTHSGIGRPVRHSFDSLRFADQKQAQKPQGGRGRRKGESTDKALHLSYTAHPCAGRNGGMGADRFVRKTPEEDVSQRLNKYNIIHSYLQKAPE